MAVAPLRVSTYRRVPEEWFVPDGYLTDGHRLFRVVSQIADGDLSFCSLEDCLTLQVQSYLPSELAAMELQPVGGASD